MIQIPNYWVLAFGKDCDGHNRGRVYAFSESDNADRWAMEMNDSSDGISYFVTCSLDAMKEYCMEYGLDWENYMHIV